MEKSVKTIILSILVLLLAVPCTVFAEPGLYRAPDYVWTKRPNRHTGRYVSPVNNASQAFTLSIDPLYYYGDMDNEGAVFKNGFSLGNVGFWGNLSYLQPLGMSGVKLRYTLGSGLLRGNGEGGSKKIAELMRPRKFRSVMARAAVGAEWYPVNGAGFYLYAGLSLGFSHVTFDYRNSDGTIDLHDVKANTFALMVPLEIGYNWTVKDSWIIGLHAGWSPAVFDRDGWNLDGNPNKEYSIGLSQWNKSPDGLLQFGITIGYSWHNCKDCRVFKW